MALRDEEPFATFRAEPRRFLVGLPSVFVGGAVVGALLVPASFELALAVQIALQTAGFLWLYVPALRRRRAEGQTSGDAADPPSAGGGRSGPDDVSPDPSDRRRT